MDILNQIVERLTKDELRYLNMSYGSANNKPRKDLLLLQEVRKAGNNFDESIAIKKLGYNAADKNSYYRLKNRVIEDIGDGLNQLYHHKDPHLELLHYMSLFHIYYGRSLYKACMFYLKKAERLAKATENYELLDNVYDSFIRLSFYLEEINPQHYIGLRKANIQLVTQLRQLDDDLADVSYRLKFTQNFGTSDKLLLHRLSDKAKTIAARTTSQFSKSLQTRIYRALSQVFILQYNYKELEELVSNSFSLFEKEKWFDKENHELKLQMLTYRANALYKIGRPKDSLRYTELLGEEISAYQKLHYDRYIFFYYNLQMLNNALLAPPKALDFLNEFEQLMRKKKNYYYDTFIFLNRAGLLFDMRKYKEALKSLVKLYVSNDYQKADTAFKLKVEISELIITFDAGETDTLLHRIGHVKKDYNTLIKQKGFKTDVEFITILQMMAQNSNYKRNKAIQKKIQALLKTRVETAETDSRLINYRDWLTRKSALSV